MQQEEGGAGQLFSSPSRPSAQNGNEEENKENGASAVPQKLTAAERIELMKSNLRAKKLARDKKKDDKSQKTWLVLQQALKEPLKAKIAPLKEAFVEPVKALNEPVKALNEP